MLKYKPEDYPVGAKFTRTRTVTDYDYPGLSGSSGRRRPLYKTKQVVDHGILAAPPFDRNPSLGGALFGSEKDPFVYVKWTDLSGRRGSYHGSANAADIVVEKTNPDEIRAKAEALLDSAGFTLIAIDKVANATKLGFNEGVLRLAGIHGREVEFRYTKSEAAPVETRRLLVENVETHGDAVLVGGKDPDRGEYRNFRLDRIKGDVRFA